jgi:O-antigen/teichoic acid export membrane protein
MPKLKQIVVGVATNWVSFGTSVLVSFFLAPFVVHHLGNVGYGVWVLVASMVSYMDLLDLGLRGAVTRFVAKGFAQGDHSASSTAVSTAFWLRIRIGLGVVVVSLVAASQMGRLFRIPPEMVNSAQWVAVFSGISFALTMTSGVFGGVVAALHRFDLLSGLSISQTLLRAAGVVVLLRTGHGIVALAMWQLFVAIIYSGAMITTCFRQYPQLRFTWGKPDKDMLGKIWDFSRYIFLINAAVQIVYYTDNLVIGAFVGAAAVTFYSVGGNIIEYLRNLVSSLTVTFGPLASSFEAQDQKDHLRRLLIQGTRAALFITLPVECALFFRAHTFVGLWMGPQYATTAARILHILLPAQFFALANTTSTGIAYGVGKHRPIAFWAMSEGAANLTLSIWWVHTMGIEGVAWGTAIPSLIIHLLLWPPYVRKLVDIPAGEYLWQSWLRPILASIPYGVCCYFTDRFWTAPSLLKFFLQIAAILPIFAIGVWLCFWKEFSAYFRTIVLKETS